LLLHEPFISVLVRNASIFLPDSLHLPRSRESLTCFLGGLLTFLKLTLDRPFFVFSFSPYLATNVFFLLRLFHLLQRTDFISHSQTTIRTDSTDPSPSPLFLMKRTPSPFPLYRAVNLTPPKVVVILQILYCYRSAMFALIFLFLVSFGFAPPFKKVNFSFFSSVLVTQDPSDVVDSGHSFPLPFPLTPLESVSSRASLNRPPRCLAHALRSIFVFQNVSFF